MPTEQQLLDALDKADAAGDTEAAQLFANDLKAMRANAQKPTDAKSQYDNMPGWQKPLVAMDDVVRSLANGATFGYADKLAAKMGGGDYDKNLAAERQKDADASARGGLATTAGNIVGGVAGLGAAGVPSLARAIPAAWPLVARAPLAALTGTAEGAGYGALDATGHGTSIPEGMKNGAIGGAIMGPATEALGSALSAIRNARSGTNNTPSTDQLRDNKNALYNDVERRGAMYPPGNIIRGVNDMNTDLLGNPHAGIREARHPAASDMLNQMNDVAGSTRGSSLYDLDLLRQQNAGDVISQGGSEAHFGRRIQRGIDDIISDTNGVTTASGTPDEAVGVLQSAREANRRLGNTEDVINAGVRGARRAASSGTGIDVGNQTRQNIRGILDSDTRSQYLNPEEIAAAERVVSGTPTGNTARTLASKLGGYTGMAIGGGAGAALGATALGPIGGAGGSLAGAGVAKGLGALAGHISNRSTQGLVDDLAYLTATGRTMSRGKTSNPITAAQEDMLRRLGLISAIDGGR